VEAIRRTAQLHESRAHRRNCGSRFGEALDVVHTGYPHRLGYGVVPLILMPVVRTLTHDTYPLALAEQTCTFAPANYQWHE
jgi:hypothetical protein